MATGGGTISFIPALENPELDFERLYFYPFPRFGRFFHRFEDSFVIETILEGGLDRFAVHDRINEIGHRMNEGMFIADDVPWRPPLSDIGMRLASLCDEDIAEALAILGQGVIEKLQPIHVFKIEGESAFGPVDFEAKLVFSPERKTSRFQIGNGPVFKPAEEQRGIIDGYFAHLLARSRSKAFLLCALIFQRPFGDEGVHQAANLLELAHQIPGQIDNVGIDVPMRATATNLFAQPPDQRKARICNPILRITSAEMIDVAESAFVDEFFGKGNGRDAPVVLVDHMDHS